VAPEELIQRAVNENRAAVESDILNRALLVDPPTFERLVLRLLEAMRYGRAGRISTPGSLATVASTGSSLRTRSGWNACTCRPSDTPRQRRTASGDQGFVGALIGAQGDRGVFITTSSFSSGARREAERVNARVVLIDGDRLAELMVRHGVGVQAEATAVLHRVASPDLHDDFFDTL
jgi:restriction system protein